MSRQERRFEGVIGRTFEESKSWWPEPLKAPEGSPNVIFIILDDVGFSQLGCYGSSIETPNMDRLAAGGLRYNNFHTTALCSPTRSCLLTGRNHHSVGMGMITEMASGYPGYNGRIPKSAGTIAHILRENGYGTFAVGKWHNTPEEETSAAGPFDRWPLGMGFERFYGFLAGDANQWNPDLVYDNHRIPLPDRPDYHLTEDIVDRSIEFVKDLKQLRPDKPFFLWMAFGAAHAPHHAPREFIDKYKGRFDRGWDVEREEVLARQKKMGIVPPETRLAPRNTGITAWTELSSDQRRLYARMQEVFAGFMDHTDYHVGRFLDFLEDIDQMENTLVVLISDNGASQEGVWHGSLNEGRYFNGLPETLEECLAGIDKLGGPLAFNHYPRGWAMAGNAPLKRYKQNTHGGGTRDPLIFCWPGGIEARGEIRTQYHHVVDIVPTILEVLGIGAPEQLNGTDQKPMEGQSMLYSFANPQAQTRKEVQYYEMLGHRGIWHKGWKAVTYHSTGAAGNFDEDKWELYHLDEDFSECKDLAETKPQKLRQLIEIWWAEAGKYQVLPLDDRGSKRFNDQKPKFDPDKTSFTFFPGTSMIPAGVVPNTQNRSYMITAEVEIPEKGAEGILLALGGRFGGYALYIQNKRLVYDYNFLGISHYRVASTIEVPRGKNRMRFEFDKTGEHQGRGTLFFNEDIVGEGMIERTAPVRHAFAEGLEIGRDSLTPVSESYRCPFAFTGILEKVVLELKGEPHLDPEGDFRLAMGRQ
jgi:arylsulfatase